MFMKFERRFLDVPVEEDFRPSRQASAAKRFIRLVSDLIEREADEVGLFATVISEGL